MIGCNKAILPSYDDKIIPFKFFLIIKPQQTIQMSTNTVPQLFNSTTGQEIHPQMIILHVHIFPQPYQGTQINSSNGLSYGIASGQRYNGMVPRVQ